MNSIVISCPKKIEKVIKEDTSHGRYENGDKYLFATSYESISSVFGEDKIDKIICEFYGDHKHDRTLCRFDDRVCYSKRLYSDCFYNIKVDKDVNSYFASIKMMSEYGKLKPEHDLRLYLITNKQTLSNALIAPSEQETEPNFFLDFDPHLCIYYSSSNGICSAFPVISDCAWLRKTSKCPSPISTLGINLHYEAKYDYYTSRKSVIVPTI